MQAAFMTVGVLAIAGLVLDGVVWKARAGRGLVVLSVLLKVGILAWLMWWWLYYGVYNTGAEVWAAPESLAKLYRVGMPLLLAAIVLDAIAVTRWQTKRTFD